MVRVTFYLPPAVANAVAHLCLDARVAQTHYFAGLVTADLARRGLKP